MRGLLGGLVAQLGQRPRWAHADAIGNARPLQNPRSGLGSDALVIAFRDAIEGDERLISGVDLDLGDVVQDQARA